MDKSELKFELKEAVLNATTVTVFNRVEFKSAGTHYVEVLVDDVMKLRYPVPLILVQQNPNQPGQPVPAPSARR